MPTAQELFEDAYFQGQEDKLSGRKARTTSELGKTYKDFDVSGEDFFWISTHYYRGYRETPNQEG
jgi:hypothetical protein